MLYRMEFIYALLNGMVAAIFIWSASLPSVPYPVWVIELFNNPIVTMIALLGVYAIFIVNDRLAVLIALCILFLLADIHILGKPREREYKEKGINSLLL